MVLFTAKTKTYIPQSYYSKEFSEKFIVKQNRLIQYVLLLSHSTKYSKNNALIEYKYPAIIWRARKARQNTAHTWKYSAILHTKTSNQWDIFIRHIYMWSEIDPMFWDNWWDRSLYTFWWKVLMAIFVINIIFRRLEFLLTFIPLMYNDHSFIQS